MPELPEAEIVRQGLERYLLGKRLTGVQAISPSSLIFKGKRCINRREIENLLRRKFIGLIVQELIRAGKLIFISFGEKKLAIHLKMTGQILVYNVREEEPDRYIRVIMEFQEVSICFNDKRRFGYIELLLDEEAYRRKISLLGVDALSPDFTSSYLKKNLAKRKITIKKFLLDQKVIAGIGNAYADEILFLSGVSPFKPANLISGRETKRIINATSKVLKKGIEKKGLTLRDFVNVIGESGNFQNHLQVYRKAGELCPVCRSTILREKVGGRSYYYCPECQK